MTNDEQIIALVRRFGGVLEENRDHLECFYDHGVQIEGWLKGELLFFLEGEKSNSVIANFDREVRVEVGAKRKQIDIRIGLQSHDAIQDVWVELKHWTSEQKGTPYRPTFYFGDSSLGVRADVEALSQIDNGDGYCLILMTANPGVNDWKEGVAKFNEKFEPLMCSSRDFI